MIENKYHNVIWLYTRYRYAEYSKPMLVGMDFARVACKSQKEGISYTRQYIHRAIHSYAVTSVFALPYNIIYIFYINLRCVYYVRFSAAGQSNLLTTRTLRTSTYHRNIVCVCIHAARSCKTSVRKKIVSHFKQILLVHSIVTRFFFIIIYLSGRTYHPRQPLPIKR